MENNFQPQVNNQMPQEQPAPQVPPAQPVPPMYNLPFMMPPANNVPGIIKFLMKFVAFFVPLMGFVLGCLFNLTSYDDKAKIGEDVLKLSGIMFVVQFAVLLLPFTSAFLFLLDTWI